MRLVRNEHPNDRFAVVYFCCKCSKLGSFFLYCLLSTLSLLSILSSIVYVCVYIHVHTYGSFWVLIDFSSWPSPSFRHDSQRYVFLLCVCSTKPSSTAPQSFGYQLRTNSTIAQFWRCCPSRLFITSQQTNLTNPHQVVCFCWRDTLILNTWFWLSPLPQALEAKPEAMIWTLPINMCAFGEKIQILSPLQLNWIIIKVNDLF